MRSPADQPHPRVPLLRMEPDLTCPGALVREYRHCHRCSLSESRNEVLCASGVWRADILLISDLITGSEEREGRILCGETGSMMSRVLAAPGVELEREQLCATALVACRGERGKFPGRAEIGACGHRLRGVITLVRPRVIVALGERTGAELLRGCGAIPDGGNPSGDGWFEGVPVWISPHPSELLWGEPQEVVRMKRMMYSRWKAISAYYHARKGRVAAETAR